MENITIINIFLQIFSSILLIYYVLRYQKLTETYNKEVLENTKNKNILYHVENALYGMKDLEGKNRPRLNLNYTLSDIVKFRTLANKYEGIKPEYEELVQKHKVAEVLRNDFRNNEFTKKFILENMPNELIAIELLKALKNKDLVINANNSKILELEETLKEIKPFELNEENKKLKCRIGELNVYLEGIRKEFIKQFPVINDNLVVGANFVVTQYKEANKKIDKLINNLANERKKFKNKNHAKDQSIYYFKTELEKLRKENNKKTGHN